MVICAEKSQSTLGLDRLVPCHAASGRLCVGGSCAKLWERIPAAYRHSHCYTDFWEAYQKVLPAAQHTPCGKETGLTAHVERWNNTLRQRLARFVRKTLSFSKSDEMHEICLRLFLHRYNLSLCPT